MEDIVKKYFNMPNNVYILSIFVVVAVVLKYLFPHSNAVDYYVWSATLLGSIPLVIASAKAIVRFRISIEVFNLFALAIALVLNNNLAALWIELMLLFASYLEWKIKSRARNAIEELLKLAPEIAHIQVDENIYKDVTVGDVRAGDILLVKAGEKIPVDGKIIFGDGVIDESSFTGESIPEEKSVGSEVYTATVLSMGVIKIEAVRVGSDTSFSRLVFLMREALKAKSKFHKFADIFAMIFLPAVAVIALVIYFTTKSPSVVAAFLVIVCADDIAVAIPLAMEAAFGKAASRGVIVKGGVYFERLATARVVIFDKTGTLTNSKIKVNNYELVDGFNTVKFWETVSIAEKFSEHPIGKAIYAESLKNIKISVDPDVIKVLPGAGVYVESGEDNIVIGNIAAMSNYNITLNELIRNHMSIQHGKTILYIALNGLHIGCLVISDSIKDNAVETISKLRSLNIKTIILTGDKKDVADDIAKEIGVDEVYSELTPEDKLNIVNKIAEKQVVVMVGDGVNDAAALARADVGIAMGSIGVAASIEAADVIIQTDNIMRVYEIIVLARRVRRVVINNFIIWFATNMIGTVLVLTRLANISVAAFYNFTSDFIPLFNSAWLFRGKNTQN